MKTFNNTPQIIVLTILLVIGCIMYVQYPMFEIFIMLVLNASALLLMVANHGSEKSKFSK